MKETVQIRPSKELAYWIGVLQTDGSFYPNFTLTLETSKKSINMVKKFKNISEKLFRSKAKINNRKTRKKIFYRIGLKHFSRMFTNLNINVKDPPTPPNWVIDNKKYFGAYLAGVIDGDGDIRIKRKKYPQCVIRIGSGKEQKQLAESITKILNCAVSITPREGERILNGKIIHGKWYELEFLVSSKNYKFVKTHILPHLTIAHKKEILEEYIIEKFGM